MEAGSPIPQWAAWTEAMKVAVWSVIADPPPERKPVRMSSVNILHGNLRTLVNWMHDHGYMRLNQLTRTGQRAFMRDLQRRKGRGGKGQIKIQTLVHYQNTLQILFLQGRRYPQIAIEEPAPQDAIKQSKRSNDARPIPKTPDAVATALIRGAIRLLGAPAEDIIEARDRLQELTNYVQARHRTTPIKADQMVRKLLKANPLAWKRSRSESWYKTGLHGSHEIRALTNRLGDAAFVVLSYLVGMRVSEILGLEVGCITKRPSLAGDETFTFVVGKIYKTAKTAEGEPHEWVAPPIVERAIEVLERISLPLRERTGQRSLWLAWHGKGVVIRNGRIASLTGHTMTLRLNRRFAPFINLPPHDGKPWHLSSHQGRKTFAYLVALKDRSGLHALKDHFGHRSIVMTDQAYSGRDHEITELIGGGRQRGDGVRFRGCADRPATRGERGRGDRKAIPVPGTARH